MIEKLAIVRPEIVLFIATCVVMLTGLSRRTGLRRATPWICAAALAVAGLLSVWSPRTGGLFPELLPFAKVTICVVGLMLLALLSGTIDRQYEARVDRGEAFSATLANRGEFYAFLLFSLTGVMLCAGADDLIWLFLALELTSLPTYVMVGMSTPRLRSQEAGVKYFFLGAFGAAIFLYGFALLYGATGTTQISEIAAIFEVAGPGVLGTLGVIVALIGVSFKIAAVPMHYYTPDVYEGAATPVTAYLAFAPKAAGFLAILLLAGMLGWTHGEGGGSLPEPVRVVLWVTAALTMTVGNTLAILQSSVKRMLAYSSIAHSGYMLVGIVAGPGDGGLWTNGLGAMLFYLLCYGLMNLGAFAVLACVERRAAPGEDPIELETVDDLKGLCRTNPVMGWALVLSALSLLGFPPLLGFWAKLALFTSAISAGEIALVVILGLNSAIAAFYYLRLVSAVYFEPEGRDASERRITPLMGRPLAAVLSAASVVIVVLWTLPLLRSAGHASSLSGALPRAETGSEAAGSALSGVQITPSERAP